MPQAGAVAPGAAVNVLAGWRPPWLEMYSQAWVPFVFEPVRQYAAPAADTPVVLNA